MSDLYALRIPKAASSAIVRAFHGLAAMNTAHHRTTLEHVPADALAIAVLRDPVDRFRSAWDMFWNDGRLGKIGPTIDDFIRRGPDAWDDIAFWPSTYWLKSADYVRERGAIVIPYEDINNALGHMGCQQIWPTHVAHVRHAPTYIDPLLEYYADDYRMIRELFG